MSVGENSGECCTMGQRKGLRMDERCIRSNCGICGICGDQRNKLIRCDLDRTSSANNSEET